MAYQLVNLAAAHTAATNIHSNGIVMLSLQNLCDGNINTECWGGLQNLAGPPPPPPAFHGIALLNLCDNVNSGDCYGNPYNHSSPNLTPNNS